MFGVTEALRQDIGALMARVFGEIKGIRVAMVVHGDYDSIQYSTMYIDFAQSDKPITVCHCYSDWSIAEVRRYQLVDSIFRCCLLLYLCYKLTTSQENKMHFLKGLSGIIYCYYY